MNKIVLGLGIMLSIMFGVLLSLSNAEEYEKLLAAAIFIGGFVVAYIGSFEKEIE